MKKSLLTIAPKEGKGMTEQEDREKPSVAIHYHDYDSTKAQPAYPYPNLPVRVPYPYQPMVLAEPYEDHPLSTRKTNCKRTTNCTKSVRYYQHHAKLSVHSAAAVS